MSWENKYNEYLGYSKEKLCEIGCTNGAKLIEKMDEFYKDQDESFAKFMTIYGSFVAIDSKVTQEEYEFFIKITGVSASYDEFLDAIKDSSKYNVIEAIDQFVDANEDMKELVINMGLAICAYDGEISEEEKVLIEKYAE